MTVVSIAIVNYRTAHLVVECLRSLAEQRSELGAGRVIVVDNCSDDDSIPVIGDALARHAWGTWVELLAMPRNGGFAYGNNAAIERALTANSDVSVFILLNPDTMVRPGALAALVSHLQSNPRAGVCGAAIEDRRGVLTASAHVMPSPVGEFESAAAWAPLSRLLAPYIVSPPPSRFSHECDWVSGACMAIRREVLDAVGRFDEGFFLYYEEVDFCRRVRAAGWTCRYVADARVMHLEGAATGINLAKRRLPPYWFASRRRFFVKAYGLGGLLAADLLWALGRSSLALRRLLGLGGRAGLAIEPERLARDLLIGDARAAWRGELPTIASEQ